MPINDINIAYSVVEEKKSSAQRCVFSMLLDVNKK